MANKEAIARAYELLETLGQEAEDGAIVGIDELAVLQAGLDAATEYQGEDNGTERYGSSISGRPSGGWRNRLSGWLPSWPFRRAD